MCVILRPDLAGRRICFCFRQDLWIPGSVLVCVAPGFSPACAALKGGATIETSTLLDSRVRGNDTGGAACCALARNGRKGGASLQIERSFPSRRLQPAG